MAKQLIRLTESDLQNIIEESVTRILSENEECEGLWNQIKRGAQSFMGRNANGGSEVPSNADQPTYNMRGRWNAARSGYKEQGRIDSNNANLETLNALAKKFGEDATIGQIINRITLGNKGAKGRINRSVRGIYN